MHIIKLTPGLLLLTAACDAGGANDPGRRIEVAVAPLALPGIVDACYGLTVYNQPKTGLLDALHTVWSLDSVCADDYGDGSGAITYIGPCDASDQDSVTAGNQAPNTVRLVLESLWKGPATVAANQLQDPADFRNPCPASTGGCLLEQACAENADALVEFNLTILRSANQGFFDIAVNFQDVFCSAKFDCNVPLLHDVGYDANGNGSFADVGDRAPVSGRQPSAVAAFACSAGVGTGVDTRLYLSDAIINCTGGSAIGDIFQVPMVTFEGATPSLPGNQLTAVNGAAGMFQVAHYAGAETLVDGTGAAGNSIYFNYAFAPNLSEFAGLSCTLTATVTAADGELTDCTTPEGSYPVISYTVPLINNGVWGCTQHPLNDIDGVVATGYTPNDTPATFAIEVDGLANGAVAVTSCALVAAAVCGDGIINQASETCDGSVDGVVGCRINCTYCGDGIVNGSEGCDSPGDVECLPGCTPNG